MREGINFGRVRTNSQCKIPKKKLNKATLSRKINLKRLKHSQETVTGKNSKEKKTREFSSIKLIQVQIFHPSVLSFNENVIGLAITVTYWLMWLFVTCVRQLVLTAWKHVILSLQRSHMRRRLTAVLIKNAEPTADKCSTIPNKRSKM